MAKLLKYRRRLPIPTQNEVILDSNILVGFIFTRLQGMEYIEAPFKIPDGIDGSTFS